MHNGTNIIRTKHIDLVRIILLKFFPPALLNIVPVDADVVISVWTIVFVPEPQCVYQLVDYSVSRGSKLEDKRLSLPGYIHVGIHAIIHLSSKI